ncbi:alpha/beta fold hydrolase [Nocardiopsis composta]|uniref:Pimeloyl-ACP methyl ester carboxylesterase n=1 Tax=Nocardiopsis composta TaxID=157465 RepID=A0A7W8QHH7_9ACTN|nr:alpha/beta hydrolase [Nocardiopsis composta]MBB5430124.1 pimeloyl-ACP methyl ester carboxylesterase [Nocardiopsis composta]
MASVEFLEPRIGREWNARGIGSFRDRAGFDRFAAAYREAMGALEEPAGRYTVATSYGQVRAYRFGGGEGTPLLLLPGRNSSTPMWRPNLPGLRRGRPVYTVDGLGEPGCSSQTARIASGADQAAWVSETIEGLGLDGVHLLGVSFGGWLGVQTLIHRPERVRSLTALEPFRTFGELTAKSLLVSLGSVLPMPARWRGGLVGMISGGNRRARETPAGRLIAAGMEHFDIRQPPPARPADAELDAITAPVLVLIGGRSIVHRDPERVVRYARARLGAGVVELWPRASHAISAEYPDEIADRVERFLAGVESAAQGGAPDRPAG